MVKVTAALRINPIGGFHHPSLKLIDIVRRQIIEKSWACAGEQGLVEK